MFELDSILSSGKINRDLGWYNLLVATNSINNYNYEDEEPPYKYYEHKVQYNRTIKSMDKYHKQIYSKHSPVEEHNIYSLMQLQGLGLSKFIFLHHYLTGKWVEETVVFAHMVVEKVLKNGSGLYLPHKKTFDGGHSVWDEKHLIDIIRKEMKLDKTDMSNGMVYAILSYIRKMDCSVEMTPTGFFSYKDYYQAEKEYFTKTINDATTIQFSNTSIPQGPTDEQKEVIQSIIESPHFVSVIQAPAGHGKTYTAVNILKQCSNILIVAPTGKASLNFRRELAEFHKDVLSKVYMCTTIHSAYYKSKLDDQEDPDILVVDESSMVSSEILKMILHIIEKYNIKKMILLGDYFQCPPVGCGFFLRDVINDSRTEAYTLTKNMRAKEAPDMIQLFTSYRTAMGKADCRSLTNIIRQYKNSYLREDIPLQDRHYDQILSGDTVIVSYKNTTVDYYNHKIIQHKWGESHKRYIGDIEYKLDGNITYTTPRGLTKTRKRDCKDKDYKGFFPIGMKLFILENTNIGDTQLANGTTIEITDNNDIDYYPFGKFNFINEEKEKVPYIITFVTDGGEVCQAPIEDIYTITKPAFCGTIHKLQGSGYNNVIFAAYGTMSSDLVYTAITRAKKQLAIFYDNSFSIVNPSHRRTHISDGDLL